MAVIESEVKWYLTGNTPATSLGGNKGVLLNELVTLNNIFRDFKGVESSSGVTVYKCLCLVNENASSQTVKNTKMFVTKQPDNNVRIELAIDPSIGTSSVTIPNEFTNPTSLNPLIVFQTAVSYDTGVQIPKDTGELLTFRNYFVWLKLIVPPGTASLAGNLGSWRVQGDTV